MACKGRLASIELPGTKTPVSFERRPQDKKPILFSLPKACANVETLDGLCAQCVERQQKTAAYVAKRDGKYVANQESLLHGRFGEPLPLWSHMFGSRWFCETQAEKGLVVPDIVLAALPKSDTHTPIEMPRRKAVVEEGAAAAAAAAAAAPTEAKPKRPRKKAAAAAAAPSEPDPEPSTQRSETATPAQEPTTQTVKPKRKFAPKLAPTATPAIGVLQPQPLGEVEVLKISVRKMTIDDRTVYLSTEKDKVYDLKFKYIGRYNRRDDRIESKYPDSDKE